jgi:hypothetical protein
MNDQSNAKSTAAFLIAILFLAIAGFIGCIAFGLQTKTYLVTDTAMNRSYEVIADSGLNGGAIGCGIFGAAALFAFVKVFLARTN